MKTKSETRSKTAITVAARIAGEDIAKGDYDIQPYGTNQAPERDDILNIGGFSDAVFNVVSSFLENDASRFVREVESVEL